MSAIALQTDITTTATLGGRYRLVRRVGAGGMGIVWEAEDAVLRRRVAVKVLAPYLCGNKDVAARFEREAQAAGRLTHPNITQVFDYGENSGHPYIVLELVAGSTLRQVLNDRGRLPASEAADVGAQIADALAAAHAEGIVHRDVKPGNVRVAPGGRVKVMDFGIADAVWFEPITDTGTIMATARYIAPEQATGGAATAASDVYSLGVVIYEALAGWLPFEAESPFAIAHAHAYEPPPPLDGSPRISRARSSKSSRRPCGRTRGKPARLMHYSPVRDTLEGEPPEIFPFLGTFLLAEAVDRTGVDLALHGHAHHGSEKGVTPGGVNVRNVAMPVLRRPYAVYAFERPRRGDHPERVRAMVE